MFFLVVKAKEYKTIKNLLNTLDFLLDSYVLSLKMEPAAIACNPRHKTVCVVLLKLLKREIRAYYSRFTT